STPFSTTKTNLKPPATSKPPLAPAPKKWRSTPTTISLWANSLNANSPRQPPLYVK
ncbi:unnamed protein product, partial [Aphanomyces euteiches]